ncbi:hypothetical protein [Olsenella uli]|uniref:hypothetical protein n=1 Tax=Olsenella uli TaxID=133926 RepID=UPI0024A8FA68|nr:hypothetical protein [Olsenella uli]
MSDERDLRKAMLNGGKTERIIFAATPQLKEAAQIMSEDRCMSMSAYITSLIVEDILAHKGVLPDDFATQA